jgi:hypothetical protein
MMEVEMRTTMTTPMSESYPVKERLLNVLRENGPHALEGLCALPDLSWAQVLLAVDHLSRSGAVTMERIGSCEYQVSLSGGERNAAS